MRVQRTHENLTRQTVVNDLQKLHDLAVLALLHDRNLPQDLLLRRLQPIHQMSTTSTTSAPS